MPKTEYILDSCVLFDLFKDRNHMRQRLQRYRRSTLAVSRVSILEVLQYANKALARQQAHEAAKSFRLISPSDNVWAESARTLRDWPASQGLPDIPDLIIGHTARLFKAKVMTLNVKDFEHIEGLEIVNPLDTAV